MGRILRRRRCEVARGAMYKCTARKRPVPADVVLILQRVVAIPERISMGFRHGVPWGSMGFRGVPWGSGAN